jgi:hypothetical protein
MIGTKQQHNLRREMNKDRRMEWAVPTLLNPIPRPEPPIASTLVSYGDDEGRLLRSEMLCALYLMYKRILLRKYQSHRIIPVCLASIIEVHR